MRRIGLGDRIKHKHMRLFKLGDYVKHRGAPHDMNRPWRSEDWGTGQIIEVHPDPHENNFRVQWPGARGWSWETPATIDLAHSYQLTIYDT